VTVYHDIALGPRRIGLSSYLCLFDPEILSQDRKHWSQGAEDASRRSSGEHSSNPPAPLEIDAEILEKKSGHTPQAIHSGSR
jgi:hypothetical protein